MIAAKLCLDVMKEAGVFGRRESYTWYNIAQQAHVFCS